MPMSRAEKDTRLWYMGEGCGIGDQGRVLNTLEDWLGVRLDPEVDAAIDIGAGTGEMCAKLAMRGLATVIGVDIKELKISDLPAKHEGIEHCRMLGGIDLSAQEIPCESDCCTIAFCTETIEHLSNPYKYKPLAGARLVQSVTARHGIGPTCHERGLSPLWTMQRDCILH